MLSFRKLSGHNYDNGNAKSTGTFLTATVVVRSLVGVRQNSEQADDSVGKIQLICGSGILLYKAKRQ